MTPLQRRSLLLAPLGLAAISGSAMWMLLARLRTGSYDPHAVPDPMIGKPVPAFTLPGLAPGSGFSNTDLAGGAPLLLNFFASWCLPCANELTELLTLQQRGVSIWGVVYKDKPQDAARFLRQNGNPYRRIAVDEAGRVAIDFGLYGVPESYLVDRHGILRWRCVGGLTPALVRRELDPLLKAMS